MVGVIDAGVVGAGGKTRLESRIQKLSPISCTIGVSGTPLLGCTPRLEVATHRHRDAETALTG